MGGGPIHELAWQAAAITNWRQHLADEFTARQKETPDYPLVRNGQLMTVTPGTPINSPHLGKYGMTVDG